MEGPILVGVAVAFVGALTVWKLWRGTSQDDPWTPEDVNAYLEQSDLYDVERLEELGAYERLLELAAAGEITGERAFERLCDSIVAHGRDWEDEIDDFDSLDDVSQSWHAHESAKARTPPVAIGDVITLGVLEIEHHHSGDRRVVGKVEGFVVFVQDVPDDVTKCDILRAKIMYFNRGKTSASATFLEVVD